MKAKGFSSVIMLLALGIMTVGQVVPQLPANAAAPGGNSTGGNATTDGGGSFVGSAFSRRLRNNNYCI